MNEKSPIERAVDLAAWLIRAGHQPPPKAHFIAARKYNVDLHDVARLVGARGGKRNAKAKAHAAKDLGAGLDSAPPGQAQSAEHFQVGRQTVAFEVQNALIADPETRAPAALGKFVGGPCNGSVATISADWFPPAVHRGDVVEFEVHYEMEDGKPWPRLLARVGEASA